MTREAASPQAFALTPAARSGLERRIERAQRRARREGRPVVAAVSFPAPPDTDPAGVVLAARRADDRWFCMEQPDRDGFALASLGTVLAVEARGPDRAGEVARAARAAADGAEAGDPAADPGAPPGTGPVWVGGLAFAPEGGSSPEWSSLAPAQLVLPEVALARRGEEARVTATVAVAPDDDPAALVARVDSRLAELAPARPPLLDPDPLQAPRVVSAAPPEHYEQAVAAAVERIGRGEFEKVVLAREVRVHARGEIDPGALHGALREVFPSCYCYCVGTPELTFLGASPELLVRRDGARMQTVALAGTTRRSADPAVDRHLGEQLLQGDKTRNEQAIVTRRIERALRRISVWVAAAEEPVVVRVQNVQHLATPIRAQLAEPVACLELAGLLHPTPAVGGEPADRALPVIPALEGLDRGWYAGAVGWTDLSEDGELCVALRCALVRGEVARLYSGCGIVSGSDPSSELAETEVKLEALLPLLS